jgi:uncharacterized OsmC-like protein
LKNVLRNIVCDGTSDNKAELKAESVSFIDKGKDGKKDKESLNKWVLANEETCIVSGSLNNE